MLDIVRHNHHFDYIRDDSVKSIWYWRFGYFSRNREYFGITKTEILRIEYKILFNFPLSDISFTINRYAPRNNHF